ncbi:hypothetical protein HMI55_005003 [Coelomomyces lativittatus]|nr:hypothetical protein HMI55_005003 [Coelomomyces lativittatus]
MSRLFEAGSQNAEQLRRLVIYRTKDLGLSRPTDEVLDLIVMLVNRGSSSKEIEKDMPYSTVAIFIFLFFSLKVMTLFSSSFFFLYF